MTDEFRELSEADDVFERFIRTLCEYDISQETAGALTLQLFGGVERTDRGRRLRGSIHTGVLAGEHTNIPGLVNHLVDLAPGARKVNGSNSTYTGLTGPVRSVGPDSGWYLNEGVLTDSATQYLAVQNPEALSEKSIDCFAEAVGSGGVTISKKGFHETVPVNASLLFIGNPVYGGWDEYSPLSEQLGAIDPALASQLDFLYVDIDGCEDHPDVPYVNPDAASGYIQHARETCSPTIPTPLENELFEELVEIHVEKMERGDVPQSERDALRRMVEASARSRLDDTVSREDVERVTTIYRRPYEEIHGVDYEPPEYDAEAIFGNGTERRKRRIVKQILAEEGHLSTSELVTKSVERGLSEADARHVIGYLEGRGHLGTDTNDDWFAW